MNWIFAHLATVQLDVVTGIALITLLFMMMQSEHERCDRVRGSWREVRRLTFAVTTAIQRGKQRQDHPDAGVYLETAQGLANELYSAVLLLYGKGKLREEYRARFMEAMKSGVLMRLLDVFAIVDIKAERKLDAWRLRIL
jgi:hypothetical protein